MQNEIYLLYSFYCHKNKKVNNGNPADRYAPADFFVGYEYH